MEETIKELLVTVDQGVQLMGEGKYHMKIRGVYDLGPAAIYPEFLIHCLTAGAVAVVTGIIMELEMPAVRAQGGIDPALTGLTSHDVLRGFILDF